MNITKALESTLKEFKTESENIKRMLETQIFSQDSFGSSTAKIAELKGKLDALEFIIACHEKEIDDDIIVDQMMDKVLRGADDSWSGRSNEVRRSHFDGFRSIASDFRNELRWSQADGKVRVPKAKQ